MGPTGSPAPRARRRDPTATGLTEGDATLAKHGGSRATDSGAPRRPLALGRSDRSPTRGRLEDRLSACVRHDVAVEVVAVVTRDATRNIEMSQTLAQEEAFLRD